MKRFSKSSQCAGPKRGNWDFRVNPFSTSCQCCGPKRGSGGWVGVESCVEFVLLTHSCASDPRAQAFGIECFSSIRELC